MLNYINIYIIYNIAVKKSANIFICQNAISAIFCIYNQIILMMES